MATEAELGDLSLLAQRGDHSWMDRLRVDPEAEQNAPNRVSRQVKSGHFVPVKPLALGAPRLVIHSPAMATALGISEDEVKSDRFKAFFSGDIDQVTISLPQRRHVIHVVCRLHLSVILGLLPS
jgi:hypothetical protein